MQTHFTQFHWTMIYCYEQKPLQLQWLLFIQGANDMTSLKEKKHHLHIELTPKQYQLLCRQARDCGLTKRAFLVRIIEGKAVKARPTQEIKALRTEIHHIGNNINQIARSVNAGIARPEDAKRGLYLLDQVYELMYQVAKK